MRTRVPCVIASQSDLTQTVGLFAEEPALVYGKTNSSKSFFISALADRAEKQNGRRNSFSRSGVLLVVNVFEHAL
jgi:hypothetical protein